MTTGVSQPVPGAASARSSGARRAGIAVLGILTIAAGLFLLFHPYSAARTLALLIGAGLVVAGVLEVAAAWHARHRWPWVALGASLVLIGLLAAFWPHVTLAALALLTGLSLIVHGALRVGLAVLIRHEEPAWLGLALLGVVNVAVGALVLAWPKETVLVLSLILGIQIALLGIVLTAAAFWHSDDHAGQGET